jgi:hypothetical protein
MNMEKDWLSLAVTKSDPIAATLRDRAFRNWWEPLWAKNWHLPAFLVFDLGVLLLRPEALAASLGGREGPYVGALSRLVGHERFRNCSRLIGECARERQDGAIRVAIEAMTRQVRAALAKERIRDENKWNTALCIGLVGQLLGSVLDHAEEVDWLTPVDLIAIWAACERAHGERQLDYRLLDRCLCPWEDLPPHRLRWRRIPTRRVGPKDISRLPGETVGYTSLRSRLPGDEWHEVLPTEWAFFQESRALGLDKLLNRQPLVYRRETPHDLVPHLRLLLVTIVEAWNSGGARSWQDVAEMLAAPKEAIERHAEGKALLFRMLYDLAQQVPRDRMSVEIAVFVRCFERNHSLVVATFNLEELAGASERFEEVLRFNDLVPHYFYASCFSAGRRYGLAHLRGSDDPYVFLNTAATSANYSAIFAVVICHSGRWTRILPRTAVQVRPPEAVRPAVLLVEVGGRDFCGIATFRDFLQAQGILASGFCTVSGLDARMALLAMIFGRQVRERGSPLIAPKGLGTELAQEAQGPQS